MGLDCEWVVGTAGADVLQIMTAQGDGFVIPLYELSTIPKSLKNFLADPAVAKVGVNISGDITRLKNTYNIVVNNWIDIGARAKELKMVPRCQPYPARGE